MATEVETKRKKLVVIDGKSVFYRGYYAMPNLSTKDGVPTGGVFGFATMALEVIRRLKPDYVAVAWDKPKTNIRKRLALYPEYKAGRKPAPADFKVQIPILQDLLEAFGWPLYELDDYEADDIMGALAVQAKEKDIETLLVTSDLDMLQLVNGHVHVYALKTGLSNIELYSPKSFEAKYGIKVEQFLDFKSLKGDSSDNIPGVPGIGEKGGLELLKEYKTLDGIYENLDLIKESTRKKLEAGKELAYLSKELARIWTDAPMKLDLKAMDGSKMKPEKILDKLQELEFRSLARQLPEIMQVAIENHHSANGTPSLKPGKHVLIDNDDKLKELKLQDAHLVFMQGRCAGKHGRDPELLSLSDGTQTHTLDLVKLDKADVKSALKDLPPVIGYDVKSSLKILVELGVEMPAVHHDVSIGAFLLNSLRREQTLTDLAGADLGYEGLSFEDLDKEEFLTRLPEIMVVIQKLYERQAVEIKKTPKLSDLAKGIEWPVIPVLAEMEHTGVELNTKYLSRFAEELDDEINDLIQTIYGLADQEFNLNAPAQVSEVLFEKIKLPTVGIKKVKSGFYSTDVNTLNKLAGTHEIIDTFIKYREYAKLKGTYADVLPKMVDENSRIHTTYSLTAAQTGRLSSNDPNLQHIPTRTDLGRRIRTAFVAGEGKKLVSADYSQFELRLAAVLAGDKELIEMFNRGADIHATTAAQVYDREVEDVTKQQRRAVKAINFGILYGMSPHGLSQNTGMTREQAVTFIDKYKEVRKPLFDYMEHVIEKARKDGYVATLFGRRRPMPDIHSSNFVVRQAAERAAANVPIQGTTADIMKMAMIKMQDALKRQHNNCNMLLQIHDSVLVECPAEVADHIAELLKDTMENIYRLPVRLDVDVTIGDNWGEL